jgi:hypothetical protein
VQTTIMRDVFMASKPLDALWDDAAAAVLAHHRAMVQVR